MNILIITAHSNPYGFAHKIAEKYKNIKEKKGDDCEILDLYNTGLKQDFLQLDEKNKYREEKSREVIQSKIKEAEEMVFVFPVRWFDCPAVLKNWFDQNFTPGFAFNYIKGKLLPEKLLKGKTARVFATAGAPRWVYYTAGAGLRLNMYIGRLGYVGIKTKSFTVFGSMGKYRQKEDRDKMIKKVEKIAGSDN